MQIQDLLAVSAERGASDLHLSVGEPPMLRIDGDIQALDLPRLEARQMRAWMDEITAAEAGAGAVAPGAAAQEADFCFDAPGIARFRVNVYRQRRGAGAVLRTIPRAVPTLEELAMGPVVRRIAEARRGLVLVTGPTGSGKSTTLAAMIDYLNATRRSHILTLEDPIEFVHESRRCLVNQRQIGRDVGDYASALRAALREDPDIILVGEMRDLETIRLALTAAETGHLVFATLHTASAPKSIDRIIDVFASGEQETIRAILSESLSAVIAQILVRRVDGGRVAASEIMLGTPAVRNLIREHKIAQLYSAMQTAAATGMQTLDQCLQRLLAEGVIDAQSARDNARYPDAVNG